MKQIFALLTFFLLTTHIYCQKHTITEMARDTIVDVRYGLSNRYYLDNKLMNIPVMLWFMQEYENPYKNIKVSQIASSIGGVYLGLGGGIVAIGMSIRGEDKALSNTFLKVGSIGLGISFIGFYISDRFTKKAVKQYNRAIKEQNNKRYGIYLNSNPDGLGMKLIF